MRKGLVFIAMVVGLVLGLTATPAHADDNIDHGEFYRSTLSVACFVDKGEFPHDRGTARWACWRVAKLKYVPLAGLRQVYRGKLGGLYGTSWGERDDLTYDGMPSKARKERIEYEATYFCYGRSAARRTWSCFRDLGVSPERIQYINDDLPKTCNDLTTWYIEGYNKNPGTPGGPYAPTRSTCR